MLGSRPMEQEDTMYSAADAAEYLGVSKSRIHILFNKGRIGREVAGYKVFSKSELDAYRREAKTIKPGRGRKAGRVIPKPSKRGDERS